MMGSLAFFSALALVGPAGALRASGGRPRAPARTAVRCRGAAVAAVDATAAEAMNMQTLIDSISTRAAKEITLISTLDELRDQKFCSLYSIDMLASCSYIGGSPDECSFDTCEVLSEEPPPFSLLERDMKERCFEMDSWARMDPPTEEYYDLSQYPEGNTKYDGSHIWQFIYDNLAFGGKNNVANLRSQCVDPEGWRAVFDRSLSGVHASIATHIADDFPDEDECRAEYMRRVGDHPDRIANIEFVYALLLTALREARHRLSNFDYEIGEICDTARTKQLVSTLISESILEDPALKRTGKLLRQAAAEATECMIMSDDFSDPNSDEWLEEAGIWQMRQRSRSMLKVMDCIQCGVCRLHGKVIWFGVATALRLIYSDPKARPLQRVEVAALITALAKLATAVRFLDDMGSLETRPDEAEAQPASSSS